MGEKIDLGEYLEDNRVLCDGAFGTCYAALYETDRLPEYANIENPDRVRRIHEDYLRAGAQLIRTNTFACNSAAFHEDWNMIEQSIEAAFNIANAAVDAYQMGKTARFAAADIGPITGESAGKQTSIQEEYVRIVHKFLELGADVFIFETFSTMEEIRPALELIGDRAFVLVQFAVNQFGYSLAGLSVHKLFEEAQQCQSVNAVGLNCAIGPGHMQPLIESAVYYTDKFISALPNAGYPQIISNRMIFSSANMDYFVNKSMDMVKAGVRIIGGCCGTTPDYIKKMSELLPYIPYKKRKIKEIVLQQKPQKVNEAFFHNKGNKKLIAVELAPPIGSDAQTLMDAAHLLKLCDVDVVTFPDSPSGRTRADSILMAEKVARETGLCVMPHICCRDKNAIAMRSQLLGAFINEIHNFLVVTGDPIPAVMRNSVESVFNFDSLGLMNIMNDMNANVFDHADIVYGGAINQGRRNFHIEIERVRKKIKAGATFFMSQPVFSDEDINRLRRLKEETGARILYGIMPFVSYKNAVFMKNEMTGINVTDEVLHRYHPDMTKEEGESAGVQLAIEMINKTNSYADGYYFSFPFNRVHMLKSILNSIDE